MAMAMQQNAKQPKRIGLSEKRSCFNRHGQIISQAIVQHIMCIIL